MPKIVNTIVKILVLSDVFFNLGLGLMGPIFAIFLLQNITFGNPIKAAEVAGFAALFYWITKSVLEIPIGIYLDENHGEKDDFWFLIIGTCIMIFIPLGYIFSNNAWQIYLLQLIYAVGAAMTVPAWFAIFTRHIDKGKEALEWSLYSTFNGTAIGLAGGISGLAVAFLGFTWIFVFVSAFTLLSVILMFLIRDNLYSREKNKIIRPAEKIHEKSGISKNF